MAQKIFPDVQNFAGAIVQESRLDFPRQRLVIADRLFKMSPMRMENLHLEDWYKVYWNIVSLSRHTTNLSDQDKIACKNVIAAAVQEKNPTRRQFLAMILIMFGQNIEASKLLDQKYLSPQLREDFAVYSRWNNLLNNNLNLHEKATIRRNLAIAEFLQNKYAELIKKYAQVVVNNKTCPKVAPKDYRIYFCWLQGEENLPPIIRCCYNSLKMNAGRYKICFIDENNFADYIDLPEHILKKYRGGGSITRTHFSDIIRVNLLEKYGGLWLDSTILVTEPLERYKKFWNMPFFTQKYVHGKDNYIKLTKDIGYCYSYGRWAGFIQGTSILHNPLFTFEKEFYNEYWQEFDSVIDYVLMDFMTDLAYENIPFVHEEMDAVPINNVEVWTLLKYLNAPYSEYPYDKIIKDTFLNKLNWKVKLDMTSDNTVFREIQRRYAPETIK